MSVDGALFSAGIVGVYESYVFGRFTNGALGDVRLRVGYSS